MLGTLRHESWPVELRLLVHHLAAQPTVAWEVDGRTEYAIDGGVFAAGAMLEWMCRELGVAERPAALGDESRGADCKH
jgi:glycerol kinase